MIYQVMAKVKHLIGSIYYKINLIFFLHFFKALKIKIFQIHLKITQRKSHTNLKCNILNN